MDKNRIEEIVNEVLKGNVAELVEVNTQLTKRNYVIKILTDEKNEISLDKCAKINREVVEKLEKEDINETYTVEVSSPGLDRPLKRDTDFVWAIGKLAKIILKKAIDKKQDFTGKIMAVKDRVIEFEILDTNQIVYFNIDDIVKAKLEFRW